MTKEERELFKPLFYNERIDEESNYIITFENGDEFLVEFYGEGESEINPLTGEDDYYWGIVYHIIKAIKNVTDIYCDDSLIELSKYNFPIRIIRLINCPECGAEMIPTYSKPALNYTCPKCGNSIATTLWETIDLDMTNYEIIILPNTSHITDNIKLVSKLTGENYIKSKELLTTGFSLFKGRAVEIKQIISKLDRTTLKYVIKPNYPIYY